MALDNAVAKGQAEPGALAHRLGGKKRVKNPGHVLLCDTGAGIADGHPYLVTFRPGANGDGALPDNRLRTIHQQVHENLVELRRKALHLGQHAIVADHLGRVPDFIADHIESAVQAGVDIGPLPHSLASTRKITQILDDDPHPLGTFQGFGNQGANIAAHEINVRRLACLLQTRGDGRILLKEGVAGFVDIQHRQKFAGIVLEAAEIGIDEADGVIDLMGDARRQLPDGGQLFRLQQLTMGILQLVDQDLLLFLFLLQRDLGLFVLFYLLLHPGLGPLQVTIHGLVFAEGDFQLTGTAANLLLQRQGVLEHAETAGLLVHGLLGTVHQCLDDLAQTQNLGTHGVFALGFQTFSHGHAPAFCQSPGQSGSG